jgi:hypothetical protein
MWRFSKRMQRRSLEKRTRLQTQSLPIGSIVGFLHKISSEPSATAIRPRRERHTGSQFLKSTGLYQGTAAATQISSVQLLSVPE